LGRCLANAACAAGNDRTFVFKSFHDISFFFKGSPGDTARSYSIQQDYCIIYMRGQ
jgi:hypothetical protein